MVWDTNYSTFEIQYSTEGSRKYAFFHEDSEIRGLSRGMALDEALKALGLSSDGIAFVKEAEGDLFLMNENGCYSAKISQSWRSYDYSMSFVYVDTPKYMYFTVCFNDNILELIQIQVREE